jgi:serine/threonine-protein kinase
MSDSRPEGQSLPPEQARRVDHACDRFEADWKRRPCIEDYLRDVAEPERSVLLHDLILLDMEYRRRRGECPTAEEYQERFGVLVREPPSVEAGPPPRPPRHELLGEIGHGGMGIVHRGRDLDLDRELVVKVLRVQHQDNPDLRRRFLEEARIGGQLQHPGVVPVYAVGRFPDRRPYFTMKLVRGQTLAELLAGRSEPEQDQPRFLKVFEQVCQTMAYAHSLGVIHRDLKPANIMVGAFGEVQVVDWGLAKVLERTAKPQAAKSPSAFAACGFAVSRVETMAGTALGTPAYMPPEQARGQVDRLDERCDVFALGAILCIILTGRPPYLGGSSEELRRQAEQGEMSEALARLADCGGDPELVALAQRCLAIEPDHRPRHAGEVVGAVTAYLESVQARLREAELERAQAQVKAVEERKRRLVQLALAGVVLLLVVVSGAGGWLWQQRRQEADEAVALAVGEARLLLEQARAVPLGESGRFREALAASRKARELARTAGASGTMRRQAAELVEMLEEEVEAAKRDRRLLAALLEMRAPHEGPPERRIWKGDKWSLFLELAEPSWDGHRRAAFLAWGLDVDNTPTPQAAARLRARPAAAVVEVVAALDEWASERRLEAMRIIPVVDEQILALSLPPPDWRHLADLADALDEDPRSKRRELRALLEGGNLANYRGRLRTLAEAADAPREPMLGLLALARALRLAGEDGIAEELLRAALRARPREVVLYHALGKRLAAQRRWPEALECYTAARALRPELGVTLAETLVNGGRAKDGLALYQRLTVAQPDNPWLRLVCGSALNAQGRHKEAEVHFHEAVRLLHADYRRQIKDGAAFPAAMRLELDLPEAYFKLGLALGGQDRHKEAEEAFHEATRLKKDHYLAQHNLGVALHRQGKCKEAEAAFRKVLQLRDDFAEAHCFLGLALQAQGGFAEALSSLRKGHSMGSKNPTWPHPSADWINRCARLVELDRLLPKILDGASEPATATERLELALLCQHPSKRLHATTARLAASAFAADPKLADDFGQAHRYNAACSAVLAAARQADDAKELPGQTVLALRRQALTWLRADLSRCAQLAKGAPQMKDAVRKRLTHWQNDADFAAVRDREALQRLPQDERAAWGKLWDDLAALCRQMAAK